VAAIKWCSLFFPESGPFVLPLAEDRSSGSAKTEKGTGLFSNANDAALLGGIPTVGDAERHLGDADTHKDY
jgi:hypothetical protein